MRSERPLGHDRRLDHSVGGLDKEGRCVCAACGAAKLAVVWTKEGAADALCRSCRVASDAGRLPERLAELARLRGGSP